MDHARTLTVVSAAQLGSGVAGMVVALRRAHPYDVLWMHGQTGCDRARHLFSGTRSSRPLIIAALGLSVGMAAVGNVSKGSGTNPKHPLVAGS
jgi:hypothetical protein